MPHRPDCGCHEKEQPLHAASHAPDLDHAGGPLVTVLADDSAAAPAARSVAPERNRAPPRPALAAVSLPLLL